MDLLLTLIFGALTGVIASRLMGTGHSLMMDMLLGIVGAFVGTFIMNMFGQTGVTGFNIYSFFVSVLGAVILIALSRMFSHRRSTVQAELTYPRKAKSFTGILVKKKALPFVARTSTAKTNRGAKPAFA